MSLIYLRPTSSAELRVECVDELAVVSEDSRVDHIVHLEDGCNNVLAGIEVFDAWRTFKLFSDDTAVRCKREADSQHGTYLSLMVRSH